MVVNSGIPSSFNTIKDCSVTHSTRNINGYCSRKELYKPLIKNCFHKTFAILFSKEIFETLWNLAKIFTFILPTTSVMSIVSNSVSKFSDIKTENMNPNVTETKFYLDRLCHFRHITTVKCLTTKIGFIVACFLLLNQVIVCVEGIRIHSVTVPPHQKSGESVQLECNYDLQGEEDLYAVKWYRGSNEFFGFVPGEETPMHVYDLPGVVVDTALSDSRKVTLRPVTRESSGKYRCEVSADFPSFHTVHKSAEMLVVDFSNSVPNITGGRSRYHVGDEVHVNCTSAKSRPAASLMWYINDEQARSEELVEYAPVQDEDGLETSRLGLKFIVGAKDFPNGVLKIRCTATVAAVYWNSAETAVEGHLPQTSPALESKGVYTGGCGVSRNVACLGCLRLMLWILLMEQFFALSTSLYR